VPRVSGFGSDWTTYHGNAEATGVDAAQTKLRPLRRAWISPTLDGQLYGEPLVADDRVIAATENNTVYVMAAHSGRILWSRHLARAVPSGDLPCGDISPEVGITGTPVIDSKRNEIFVDA
jgi:outer membrane protein assembly factor BamB